MPTVLEEKLRSLLSSKGFRKIPEATGQTIIDYAVNRLPPGHCVHALLVNDLRGFVGRADLPNIAAIQQLVWLVDNLPYEMHGTPEKVAHWLSNVSE